jgi:hypothetical protein
MARKTQYELEEIQPPSGWQRISQEKPQRDNTDQKKKVSSQQQRFQEYNEDEDEYLQYCNIFDQVAPTKQSDRHERADMTFSILEQSVLKEGGATAIDTRKDSTEQYSFTAGCERIDNTDLPFDKTDIHHDPAEVNITAFLDQPVLIEGGEQILTIQDDCTTDSIQARSENIDKKDEYDLDVSSGDSIRIHELDDLLELPDVPEKTSANQTVQEDAKQTDNDNDDAFAEMNSGCVVSLSIDTEIVVEKVHPMESGILQQPNYTLRLQLDETKKIFEISDTNDDFSIARHDCESAFYDVASHMISLNDAHHDWGIHQRLETVRRPRFGRGPDAIVSSLVFSFRDMEVSTIGIHRHECWDPGGQQKMKTEEMKTSEYVAIGDDDIYTIFRLHSSVYVWDPGGSPIDQLYSIHRHLQKTFQTCTKPYQRNMTLRFTRGFRRARGTERLRKPLKGVGVTGCDLWARVKGLKCGV